MSREINASVVNVSGRQRMLSQRIALFSLRLVCTPDPSEQEYIRHCLLDAVELMEKSHQGLLYGDSSLQLPGEPSKEVYSLYFEAPHYVNEKVHQYIQKTGELLKSKRENLTLENPHLNYIINAASGELLQALDAVVTQYQKESEIHQSNHEKTLVKLYKKSKEATQYAQKRNRELQETLTQLQQAQAHIIQAEKMSCLGQLLAGVAHEINNPVTFLYGNINHAENYIKDMVDLIKVYQKYYPMPSDEIQDQIEAIDLDFLLQDLPKVMRSMKIASDRIVQIVLSLRNFSRKDEAEKTQANIEAGIESTLLILEHRLKENTGKSEIKIIKEFGKLPDLECYPGPLNQVFMNLISNAMDALEEWQKNTKDSNFIPTISIRTEMKFPDKIRIRIADNGPGISEEVKSHLFEPFFTTKPVGQGTGLGLSISHQIVVEKHGGSLKCLSEVGQGTEFVIELPVHLNQLSESKPTATIQSQTK